MQNSLNLREFFEFALNANVCEYVIDTRRELKEYIKIWYSKNILIYINKINLSIY